MKRHDKKSLSGEIGLWSVPFAAWLSKITEAEAYALIKEHGIPTKRYRRTMYVQKDAWVDTMIKLGGWEEYELEKKLLQALNLPPAEYEDRLQKLLCDLVFDTTHAACKSDGCQKPS